MDSISDKTAHRNLYFCDGANCRGVTFCGPTDICPACGDIGLLLRGPINMLKITGGRDGVRRKVEAKNKPVPAAEG